MKYVYLVLVHYDYEGFEIKAAERSLKAARKELKEYKGHGDRTSIERWHIGKGETCDMMDEKP